MTKLRVRPSFDYRYLQAIFLHHAVQCDSETHPASAPVGTNLFPGTEEEGVAVKLTSHLHLDLRLILRFYMLLHIRFQDVTLK